MTTKKNTANQDREQEAGAEEKVPRSTSQNKQGQSQSKSLSTKIKELETALEEERNKYLRLSADFDNYRKRTLKEKMDLTKLAGEEILTKMLPVLDDLERALNSVQETVDTEAIKEGIRLIYNKFSNYLSQQGIKEIEALHKDFDTDFHEAVSQTPAPDETLKGKVVDVIEKGYLLNGKVIRHSKVIIGN